MNSTFPKTETVEAAMVVLHDHHGDLISDARIIADELIAKDGSANTASVYDVMVAMGLVHPMSKLHWLGAVFRNKKYRPTGKIVEGVGHAGRGSKEWVFA